ncbi:MULTISPECIES: SNF2-related protein [unclassified Neisseria]|uniref:SNF2-related protein n=1 Tax=unclassified Neisseria TaxID=2623750 RepID=UPI0026650DE5|nr:MULTISPECIES: SNF2-related protein [unclassified Neisseria]MDO1510785.1 SNF2-related protein [Neisseria sp. MVDL19-042950]MDO1517104.1 SNF2-related protein [Neisseria sp. MVDL18-041461]MDO1564437.1 SNF2-related protein [Neisseria sp. MVDL20-010259]
MQQSKLTPHQSKYFAWQLTRQAQNGSMESLASTLVDSQVDLNPHQVDAALFACQNPLSKGVILADEVGLGKTIEAGLVVLQHWAERKRNILIITPANLRKQWHQELQEKFGLQGMILEAKSYNTIKKQGKNPFRQDSPIICSYQFAKSKADDLKAVDWDLVVLDEAHRLRNVYKKGNVIAKTLQEALDHVHSKVLLTATPLQNSLLELYGLVSIIDRHVFGNLDSFRSQFGTKPSEQSLQNLRQRLQAVCKRTLRRQVQAYVPYTTRLAIVQEFTPSDEEKALSALVADYLRRPNLQAMPQGQRQLISLVLWKLLASSSRAIAGALDTMSKRLQGVLNEAAAPDLVETLDEDYESLDETAEEWENENSETPSLTRDQYQAIADEIEELNHFKTLAQNIREDAKGKALFGALEKAFAELKRLGAAQKAIIFTESKRTQEYLLECLSKSAYAGENGDGIVLFNGTNSGPQAQTIYKNWLKKHEGSDKITGSKTADTRAALVEHFKEHATIMIATEAGAEGINLQFCSLVINYDLPWNPQRIEQRIGRCHRYGQKHDVVVVNFLDKSNEADARVYELLSEKFQLFEGVFGASDEVLGAIGSGVDIERRIADIYRHCRQPDEIKTSFDALQQELSGEINAAMTQTRQTLLENFDEEVQAKLKIRADDSERTRSKYEKLLLNFTRSALGEHATFDAHGFTLNGLPENLSDGLGHIPVGYYELPRQSGTAHLYRINHPLAQALLEQAKSCHCPPTKLVFDYGEYQKQHGRISTLEPYIGQSGQLIAKLVTIRAFNNQEQYLLTAAITDNGEILQEADPEKLIGLPASQTLITQPLQIQTALSQDIAARRQALLHEAQQRNLDYFEQEVQKLDDWADDLKHGLEQEIKETDRQIKEIRRTATTAATLEEKLAWQKKQRELESKRTKQRRELFDGQDDIENQRNELIEELERSLQQQVEEEEMFVIEWEIIR